ncbi:MAG: prepilin peptidase [Lachnospiraceae bacterium]|nr:prepilin peptidase [Lachnospiraceae bacterium]
MLFVMPFLGWNAYRDLKSRKVSIGSLFLFALLRVLLPLWSWGKDYLTLSDETTAGFVAGALFGTALLLLSVASRGGIGSGDAFTAMVAGAYLGLYKVLLLFMGGFVMTGVYGGLILLFRKKGRKDTLPLLPFLLVSGAVLSVLELMQMR